MEYFPEKVASLSWELKNEKENITHTCSILFYTNLPVL